MATRKVDKWTWRQGDVIYTEPDHKGHDAQEAVQSNKSGHGCHDTETGHPAPCPGDAKAKKLPKLNDKQQKSSDHFASVASLSDDEFQQALAHAGTLTDRQAGAVLAHHGVTPFAGSSARKFLVDTLIRRRNKSASSSGTAAPSPSPAVVSSAEHQTAVLDAVREIDHQMGRHNIVPLVSLIDALEKKGLSRDEVHAAVNVLRKRGDLSGVAVEGRHGITDRERQAAIDDGNDKLIGYVSLRS